MKFAFVKEHQKHWPVEMSCRVLRVSRSGFYAWQRRRPSARQTRQDELLKKIRQVMQNTDSCYGSPRVHRALLVDGQVVSRKTVAKLMRQAKIRAKSRRRYVPHTTDSRHQKPVADDLLARDFQAQAPNCKWLADITYIPTDQGWLYLAAVLDCYSRKIVGWSMADHLESDLAGQALKMALVQRPVQAGALVHHSDRGVQYASEDYRHLLSQHGIQVSMSGQGDCYDNAMMESFWASLKTELIHHQRYATREQARQSIFQYLEVFYNRKRLHSSLGYVSPESFEAAA
jgi:putative transposase